MAKLPEEHKKKVARLMKLLDANKGEIVVYILELQEAIEEAMEGLKEFAAISGDMDKLEKKLRPKAGDDFPTHRQVQSLVRQAVGSIPKPKDADEKKIIDRVTKEISKRIRQPKDGRDAVVDYDYITGLVTDSIVFPEQKEVEPVTSEQVRDLLEFLVGDERLDMSAIRGLEPALKELKSSGKGREGYGGTPFYKMVVDDLTDDVDGATKVFTLSKQPKKFNTMLVWGSDFPVILRPTTDFTVAGKTLTLTAEVDTPSNGATLIVQYESI